MKKEEKIAICRIFTDLIKADGIIDSGEMRQYAMLRDRYGLCKEEEIAAANITFADAVNTLSDSEKGLRIDFLGDCADTTISDGFCARSEALFLIALRNKLLNEDDDIQILSIPKPLFNITAASVLYVESREEVAINDIIRKEHRTLFKECQLAGFNFIYIPKVIEHYKNTDRKLTNRIISFLAPSFSEESVNTVIDGLLSMTTSSFCKDILCNKLGISALRETSPSLLIKIGESYVGDNIFANYFRMEVGTNIVAAVQKLIDTFMSLINADIIPVSTAEEKKKQFLYYGFYKQLLDIFLVRKSIRSRLVIQPYTEEIYFPDIDKKLEKLHRREKALYVLLLIVTQEGGVNFLAPKTAKQLSAHKKKMERLQDRYQMVYELFGGEKGKAPDLSQAEIRRPMMSCLKKSLSHLDGALYNAADYMLSKDDYGNIRIGLETEIQYIHNDIEGVVRLDESEIYNKVLGLK